MTNLLAARWLFGMSMAFHIVFAAIGVAMPLLMVLAELRWRRTGEAAALELSHRWAKGVAVLFAVGAVSGTVISFELGLLWPRFMAFAGPIFGMPFSLEGFAFFAEAIFLGIFLYGRDRVSPRLHLASGFLVALAGAMSAFFVTLANAWMNHPAGFQLLAGKALEIDPVAAMFPAGWGEQVLHVLISCYAATAVAVAGIHAFYLRRTPGDPFHRAALATVLPVAMVASLLQPFSGHLSAQRIAVTQPVKLAALEGHFKTQRRAPLRVGGFPDVVTGTTPGAIEIPGGLSLLAFNDLDAEVRGLEAFPRERWPDPLKVHLAFDVMVALGSLMAALSLGTALLWWRRRALPEHPALLAALAVAAPAGFLALEAGWLVTEWGRQPFAVWGVMRTADAVTPVGGLEVPLVTFAVLYVFLALVTVVVLRRIIRKTSPAGRSATGATP
jgi:cytochrome d ubiquinol oxidase subunit I